MEAYDTTTKSWSTVAPMSTQRSDFGAAIGPDGRIYAFGGVQAGALLTWDTTEDYAPAATAWLSAGKLSQPRFSFSAATGPDGRVYALGGRIEGPPMGPSALVVPTLEIYGP